MNAATRSTLIAAILLALFWWQAISASTHWSQTSDELPHITAGYAYDKFGDFRLQPENGNFPQRVHGLAPLMLGTKFPMQADLWKDAATWQLGWDFLYNSGNPTDRIVLSARTLNALFGVALGAFIFAVARRWHGDAGGLLALTFYAFCPNFLTHSALATSDMAVTLLLTLASWCFWRHLARRDLGSGAIAGLCTGFALVAKFSGVLIMPIYALLAMADALWRRASGSTVPRRLGANLLFCLGQAAAGVLVVWAFYDFRFGITAPGTHELVHMPWSWTTLLSYTGWEAPIIRQMLAWKLLPEAWLYGLTNSLAGEAARPAFFATEYSMHGWWQFFPTLFLVKTPLSVLAALLVVTGMGLRQFSRANDASWRKRFLRWMPVAVPALVVWVVALTSHLNIGHRHILAVYPVLFIALGRMAHLPPRWLLVPLILTTGQITESLLIRPHYPAFFNVLAGGPSRAYRLVVDSSLDWGQSLPALRDWLVENRRPGEKFHLGYFGSAWPPHYGVRPTYFLPAPSLARPPLRPYEYEPGLYCISATILAEVYSDYRGPWNQVWEDQWREPPADYAKFDALRFARLCHYLQNRKPDAQAGYSILIYRLDATELHAALHGPVKGW